MAGVGAWQQQEESHLELKDAVSTENPTLKLCAVLVKHALCVAATGTSELANRPIHVGGEPPHPSGGRLEVEARVGAQTGNALPHGAIVEYASTLCMTRLSRHVSVRDLCRQDFVEVQRVSITLLLHQQIHLTARHQRRPISCNPSSLLLLDAQEGEVEQEHQDRA